jgi:type VI secretion system secreted protein VgrG
VHRMYIRNQELDLALGTANEGKEKWQIYSATNVMGKAANKAVPRSSHASPSAMVHPYYLEYIRRHFSEVTHKNWRVGYE